MEGNHALVGQPIVAVEEPLLLVASGQLLPKSTGTDGTTIAEVESQHAFAFAFAGQPEPNLVGFLGNERPHLISLYFNNLQVNLWLFRARSDAQVRGHCCIETLQVSQQPGQAHVDHPADAPQGNAFQEQFVDQRFLLRADGWVGGMLDELALASLALVVLLAVVNVTVALDERRITARTNHGFHSFTHFSTP